MLNPKNYYHEFKSFLAFVMAPVYSSGNTLSRAEKAKRTWMMFVIKMILALIVGVAIGVIYDPVNKTTISMTSRFSPLTLFIVTVFILSFLEEIAFRLSMKFKPIYLASTLAVIAYYVSTKAVYHTKLTDTQEHFEIRLLVTLTILMMSYPLFSTSRVKGVLEHFWSHNFKWIFYVFYFGFAWVHIFNYELTLEHLLLMPLITLPKLVNAFCYGYVRITYGFLYSFAIHALTNTLGFVVNVL